MSRKDFERRIATEDSAAAEHELVNHVSRAMLARLESARREKGYDKFWYPQVEVKMLRNQAYKNIAKADGDPQEYIDAINLLAMCYLHETFLKQEPIHERYATATDLRTQNGEADAKKDPMFSPHIDD